MNDLTPAEETAIADPMIAMIERVIASPDMPVDRIAAVLDLRERQLNKEAEQAFNVAFAAAMGEMPSVPRTGKNTHTKNSYSTLDDLIKTARPVLSSHGLSLNWETGKRENGNVWVRATVRHALGHSISTEDEAAPDNGKAMNHLQGGGSATTYLKRYTGFAILGLASGDEVEDDGAAIETIDADQYRELRDLAEQAGVDVSVICQACKVSSLEGLPASAVPSVKRKLNKTIDQKGAR